MSLVIHDVEQRTDEWYAARLGMVTASSVGVLLTPTGKVADNDSARRYVTSLAAERLAGYAEPGRISADMWRGIEEEPLARAAYVEHQRSTVTECGLMVRDDWGFPIGYSPDGLVGDVGQIEIKSRLHHVHVSTVLSASDVPPEVWAQLQCGLLVSGRSWVDYISYSSGMALWVKRVHADDGYQRAIVAAATQAEDTIAAIVDTYQSRTEGLPVMPRTPDYSEIEV